MIDRERRRQLQIGLQPRNFEEAEYSLGCLKEAMHVTYMLTFSQLESDEKRFEEAKGRMLLILQAEPNIRRLFREEIQRIREEPLPDDLKVAIRNTFDASVVELANVLWAIPRRSR